MAYANKEKQRAHYKSVADYKRLVVNRWKRRKGCVDCGYKANYDALELDHLPGLKGLYTVASLMYHSWKQIKEEIAKCEIVCCNCHAIRTRNREKLNPLLAELADVRVLETRAFGRTGSTPV
jgi:hypothetical protein